MSGKEVSLKKNFIMNAALGMSAFIFPLVTAPYVLRVLGPEGNGKVSFATSVVSYFALFSQLGIPTYGVRACAEVRDDREALSRCVEELLFINLVMSAVSYAAFFAAVFLVPNFRENKELFFIASLTILFNCIGMEWLFKGLEKYRYITIRSLIFKVIALVVMFAIVRTWDDTAAYAFTTVLAAGSAASILVKRVLPADSTLQCFVNLLISAVLFFGVYGGILLAGHENLVTEITGQVLWKIGIGKERR